MKLKLILLLAVACISAAQANAQVYAITNARIVTVAGPAVDGIAQVDMRIVVLEIRGHFCIEVAFALKKIDQVPPTLFHQVGIDGGFGKYRNQFLHLTLAKKGKRRKLCALDVYFYDRTGPGIDHQIGAVDVFVIVRVVQINLAGEVILFGESLFHPFEAGVDSFWRI